MSIKLKYNQFATTSRETAVGISTIKKAYTAYLATFACHVQPMDSALAQTLGGTFGKHWIMFCPVADIKEGDKVVIDTTTEYRVTGVKTFNFSGNPHAEVTLKAFNE